MSLIGFAWDWYARNRDAITAIGALFGGGILAWGALQQPAFSPRRSGRTPAFDPALER